MNKKHWMAVHTWVSEEARISSAKNASKRTDLQFFERLKNEKAECVQHWAGACDFFYCHWIAETEADIHELLETAGISNLIVTMPNEMVRYISAWDLTNEPLAVIPSN